MDGTYVSVPLTDNITVGFPLVACRCGARLCVGDIARRARRGIFERETAGFLEVDGGHTIKIHRHAVVLANARRKSTAPRDTPTARERIQRLKRAHSVACTMAPMIE